MFYMFLTYQLDIIYHLIHKSSFIHYFKLQKLEFKQLINDRAIDL